ncbi:MAG: GNAT family N-acetyltransferase [Pseudomonadota bacterium]
MTAAWQQSSTGPTADRVAALAALIPVVETPRLRLRAPRIEDFETYIACLLDADDTPEETWLDFNQMVASWPLRGFGPWTIETPDRRPIGLVPLDHEFGDPEPEIGWFLTPAVRGQGLATEAARAALTQILGPMGFASIVSYIDVDNAASRAVAARLGGTLVTSGAHPHPDVLTHRYTAEVLQ